MSEQKRTYTQMRNEFYEKFKKEISPKLQQYEYQRKLFQKDCLLAYIPCLLVAVGILVWSLYSKIEEEFIQFTAIDTIIILLVAPYGIYRKKIFKYIIDARERTLKEVCKIIGNITYNSESYFVDELATKNLLILEHPSKCYVRKTFKGTHKNVQYTIKDVSVSTQYESRSHSGLIVNFNINKNFKSKTVILSDSFKKSHNGLRLTVFEDISFENRYNVYTDDEVEARYLINPAFMEKLTNLKIKSNFKEIRLAFTNGKIILGLFEEKNISPLKFDFTDETEYLKIYDDIVPIIRLIDFLELDKK